MTAIPSGTIAFLFTDIEGSTKLWEARPEAMKNAVERHDAICRDAIESAGGYVFKTVGDAFCAAFARASEAIAAASAIRGILGALEWGETPIRVRMGIHAGSAEERDGDYFGQTVNRAARISAAGSGGQILVSLAARDLAKDSLPQGAVFRDLGARRLKDIAAPERVFQLDEEGQPTEFPPLKTLDSHPNNLPEAATSFFGREEEEATIIGLIDATRLVTLTGPGGTGKTRLALECAGTLVDRFRDGVWFVDLASVAEPGLLESAIARALGMPECPGAPVVEALLNRLREAELLVVLDNCEHLVEACARWAAASIAACRGLRVLATSREALMVNAETTFNLEPLSVPPSGGFDPAALDQFEAVRLFIDRARSAGRRFPVDAETAPYIAGICERLDGIPLALELAAAQLRVLSLAELHRRLGDVFGALRTGVRGASARQSTLRGLVDWSWNLLSPEERRAWARLSLFRGGFTLDAAEALLGNAAYGLVESLSLKSILKLGSPESAEARFGMLETLRAYGSDRLTESDGKAEAESAFIDWLVAFARRTEPELFTLRDLAVYARLDAETPNVFAGLDAALDAGRRADAVEILFDLMPYLFIGRSPLAAAVDMLARFKESEFERDATARARLILARLWKRLVLFEIEEDCVGLSGEASEAARISGDGNLLARAELVRTQVLIIQERYPEAFRLALDLVAAPPGDRQARVKAEALAYAGACVVEAWGHRREFDPRGLIRPGERPPFEAAAKAAFWEISLDLKRRSLELSRQVGDLYLQKLGWTGDEAAILGDYAESRKRHEEAYDFRISAGLFSEAWYELDFLVSIDCMAGDRDRALARCEEFKVLERKLGIPFVAFRADDSLLNVRRFFGEWEEAERLARSLADRWGDWLKPGRILREFGLVLIERGRLDEAEPLLKANVELNTDAIADNLIIDAALVGLWRIRLKRGSEAAPAEMPARAARAAGAALRLLDALPKFDDATYSRRSRGTLSWKLPEGLGYVDVDRLNLWEIYSDANVYIEFFREAEAAMDGAAFAAAVREGWEAGLAALWPLPPPG